MSDIEELIQLEPYKSCYEYGELKGREDALKPIKDLLDSNVSQIYLRQKLEEIVNG